MDVSYKTHAPVGLSEKGIPNALVSHEFHHSNCHNLWVSPVFGQIPEHTVGYNYMNIYIYIYVGRELSTVGLLTLPTFGLLA